MKYLTPALYAFGFLAANQVLEDLSRAGTIPVIAWYDVTTVLLALIVLFYVS